MRVKANPSKNQQLRRETMTKTACRALKVVAISLFVAAISRSGVALAVTLPAVKMQGVVTQGLQTPTSLAFGGAGALYVADPATRSVLRFNAAGTLVQKTAVGGKGQGVAVAADGRIAVALKDSVALFDATGAEIRRLGSGAGQFVSASGITFDDAGRIYVSDSGASCVQVFKADGTYVSRFGSAGRGAGQFTYPTSIAFEQKSRQIAVVDSLNGRVQFYDANGAYVKSVGSLGSGPLSFMHPHGVAFEYPVDGSVRMYVSDKMLGTIQAIDPAGSGTFLTTLSDNRSGRMMPSELAFDQNSKTLYAVNGFGGVSYFQVADGAAVVAASSAAAPASAQVIASNAQAAAGTSAASSAAVAVSPLAVSMVADGSTVTAGVLDVSGVATGAAAVTVNNRQVAVTNGLFSTAVPLAAGSNEIAIAAVDASGKSWKEVRKVTLDNGAPLLTVGAADIQVASKGVLELKGTVDRPAFVSIAGIPAAVQGLEWSSAVTLTPGLNTVEVQAVDLTGQGSAQKITVFYTPSAADLAVTSPAADAVTSTASMTISGTVSDTAAAVTAQVNGVTVDVTVTAGQFSLPVEFTQEGAYTVTLTAISAGGELSTVARTLVYRKAP